MSFFQNVFDSQFRGEWVLGDRMYSLTFIVNPNRNRSDIMLAWNVEPYDFSTDDILHFNFAYDQNFKNYATLNINVAGATPAVTLASEVVAALNANATFFEHFEARFENATKGGTVFGGPFRVIIKSRKPKQAIRAYISNTDAEKKLKFNRFAPVAELPTYFSRHTIDNRFVFEDSQAHLIELDETDAVVDQPIIVEAGFVAADMLDDWELLRGRAWQTFKFTKNTYSGGLITVKIEYPAGAKVGDLAKKTFYEYTGVDLIEVTETPHILIAADLIAPP